jgi:hypothetical protein
MHSDVKFIYLANMLFAIEGIQGKMTLVQNGSFLVSVAILQVKPALIRG